MAEYKMVEKFLGYRNKEDITKLPQGTLVSGSQNVVSTDGETISIRQGYTLYGQANASLTPIESSFDWNTNTGVERNVRSYSDELEVAYTSSGTTTWKRIADGWSAVDFEFTVWWDATENIDVMLFVNGDSNIYAWPGGMAAIDVDGSTATTLKLQDATSTWAEQRFFVNPGGGLTYTKSIIINSTTYTYTGGESTNTLTGLSADPRTGNSTGDVAIQGVTTFSNKPASDSTTFPNDYIATLNNQVYIGSSKNNTVYIGKNTDFTNYTPSAPRLPGEGTSVTLDGYCSGFAVGEEDMYISSGKDFWFRTKFTLSDDITTEDLAIRRLKTSPGQAVISRGAIGNMKNYTVFISNEPTLDFLGRIENIDTVQSEPISDAIKKDFDTYTFTNAHIKFFKNNLYIALPSESKVLVYNLEKGFWEAPWILPARRLAVIAGDLYIHSNSVAETYKMFDGYNDNNSCR